MFTGQSPLPESPEAAKKLQDQARDNADKLANQEAFKTQFDTHSEVQWASNTLNELVNPEEKERIMGRLLLKFEKSPDDFDFSDALDKVFHWENMGGIPSSGIDIENKDDIYNALLSLDSKEAEDFGDMKTIESTWVETEETEDWDIDADFDSALDSLDDEDSEVLEASMTDNWEDPQLESDEDITEPVMEWEENISSNLEAFHENPVTPILGRFNQIGEEFNIWQVTENDCAQIINQIGEGEFSLEALNTAIQEVSFENKDVQAKCKTYVSKAIDMNPKLPEVEWEELIAIPEELKNMEAFGNPESKSVQLFLANYKQFPAGTDGKPNLEADIQTGFELAVNNTIEGKAFPRNEAYEVAMQDIHSGDPKIQLSALSYINSLVGTEQAKGWQKDKAVRKKMNGEHKEKKQAYLDFKSDKISELIASTEDAQEKAKLEAELIDIQEMMWTEDFFEEGEVFAASDFEVGAEGTSLT